ncbi:MAG: A24 family peptidase [Acidobacteriota bacterium]
MMHVDKQFLYPVTAALIAVTGAAFDVKDRRIPNFITGPALLLGLTLHTVVDGWHGLLTSLAAGLICGVLFLVFYIAGGMGAGDVKLMLSVGCIAGLPNTSYLLILTAIIGGLMGVGMAVLKGRLKETLFNVGTLTKHHGQVGLEPHPELNVRNNNTLRLPYGLAIAAGSVVTLYLQGIQR